MRLVDADGERRMEVKVRRWSVESQSFGDDVAYELCLPRGAAKSGGDNPSARNTTG